MTTLILQATPLVEVAAARMQVICLRLLGGLDSFVATRARNAVPEQKLGEIDREIDRYRGLMHAADTGPGSKQAKR
jgi:hypothetical protein